MKQWVSRLRAKAPTGVALFLLITVVVANLILPLLTLLAKSVEYEPFYQGFADILGSNSTRTALVNSCWVTLAAACLAVSVAFFYAYVVEIKLDQKFRRIFRFLAILPMLVPSITHGVVIVYLFGQRGIFTRLFSIQLPIYGPLGIVLGSFFYAFPAAFLILSQAFAHMDGRYFETADVLGASHSRRFLDIILPIMKYALFSAFTVCFTMIFTDYGIPISVGGTFTILPVLFYKNVIGLLDFSRGAIYSTLLLLPAAVVYAVDVLYFSRKQVHSSQNPRPCPPGTFHVLQKIAFALLTAVVIIPILIIAVVPFIEAWPYNLQVTLRHFQRIISMGALGKLVQNSVLIALASGIGGSLLAFIAGYIYVRDKKGLLPLKKLTHGLYLTSLAIPGLALGLAYALFFRRMPIYNTAWIIILCNIVHYFGSPYMMVISHFKLLNPNLEAICQTLGGNWWNILVDVILPNSKQMILDVFVYFFTNSMITLSAVSMLYTAHTKTLAVQLTAYSDQGTWESAIAVSLVILVINVVMKLLQLHRMEKQHSVLSAHSQELV